MKPRKKPEIAPIQIPWQALLCIAVLAALPYLQTIFFDFTFDDNSIVLRNPAVQEWGRWKLIFLSDYWPGGVSAVYRPLTILSFALERVIHGADPMGFHLVNILLHMGTTLLVLRIAADILGFGWASCLAAALFAVHPIHTEAISGVVGRAELLSSFFALSSFWMWTRLSRRKTRSSSAAFVMAGLFSMALLSKENVIVLPVLLLLWEAIQPEKGTIKEAVLAAGRNRRFWSLLAVSCLFLLVRAAVLGGLKTSFQSAPPFVENPLASMDWPQRMLNAIANQTHGMILHLWPSSLLADYSYSTLSTYNSWANAGTLVFLILLSGTVVLWLLGGSKSRALAFGCAWYFTSILPTSNIFFPIGTIFAERLFYFPSVGICLAIASAWKLLDDGPMVAIRFPATQRGRWLLGSAALVILSLGISTVVRNRVWENDLKLFGDTVSRAPKNVKAHLWLADALVKSGRAEDAIPEYRRALEIYPDYAPAAANLMVPLQVLGRYREAIEAGERTVSMMGYENSSVLFNLALAYLGAGNPERFLTCAQRVITLDPNNARMHLQLGKYYMQQTSDRDMARHHFEEALRLDPRMAEAPMVRSLVPRLK